LANTILTTKDNSNTIYSEHFGAHYHSIHGAIEESVHVFISAGLYHLWQKKINPIRIFEMGLGTGLNALLSYVEASELQIPIIYHSIESHPISMEEAKALNYSQVLKRPELSTLLNKIHSSNWDEAIQLSDNFYFKKSKAKIEDFQDYEEYDLIYYDAFAPSCQAHLWSQRIHSVLYEHLAHGGSLVTYCSQGAFRRMLESLGYHIEKLNGPARKREMIRATKY